jgi:hypothetical protein
MLARTILMAAFLAMSVNAAPPLTTIQDVLYKADGTSFDGTLTITWTSFEAQDQSAIPMQRVVTKVLDGALRVQLVPSTTSTPATYYTVTYNSDGRVQFQETWAVPSSAQVLRVRDVRVSTTSGNSTSGSAGAETSATVAESDVTGLIADLTARPVKGAAYTIGRVVVVNTAGALDSVTGTASDCVHVDGSSGSCGSTPPSFIDGESLTGIVDGANRAFSLNATPRPSTSLHVYRNGLLLKEGSDYTSTGSAISFTSAAVPQQGDTLLASYRVAGTDTTAEVYSTPQVLCSGTGATVASTALTNAATCKIPAGLLVAGDRVEVRYDFSHNGTASGFTAQLVWGSTVVFSRDGGAADTLIVGRGDASILTGGAQWSGQSWGSVAFQTGTAEASDDWSVGLTLALRASLAAAASDTVSLRNYTVLRYR